MSLALPPYFPHLEEMLTLAHHTLTSGERRPEKAFLFLHGILGRGNNWRGMARALIEARPEWAAVLVDLRHHGDSLGFPPPDDLESAAADVIALADSLELPLRGLLGHSFGGKVALKALPHFAGPLEELIIVDVDPSDTEARSRPSAERFLSILRTLEYQRFASRKEFIDALIDRGSDRASAEWLAMNLVRDEDGFRFGPDLGAIDQMLDSHLSTDLMDICLSPPAETHLYFVRGGRSLAVADETMARLEGAARAGILELIVAPEAGHNVHMEAPAAIRGIFERFR